MYSTHQDCRRELALANHILANEGILDAFGHVSVRHPGRSGNFLLSISCAPELVRPDDIVEYGPDSEPVEPLSAAQYSERYIHGEIYRLRPGGHAFLHHGPAPGARLPAWRPDRRPGSAVGQPG